MENGLYLHLENRKTGAGRKELPRKLSANTKDYSEVNTIQKSTSGAVLLNDLVERSLVCAEILCVFIVAVSGELCQIVLLT